MSRILAFLFVLALSLPAAAEQERLTVFAAASMKDAIDQAAAAFEAESGAEVVVSFASSSVLARQIEAGAPADVFVSANLQWMDRLEERRLIRPESRRNVAGNRLVIASGESMPRIADPGVLLGRGRFAMGDPGHVPAGIYAKSALESLGLWERLEDNAVFGENVRVALELARRGEVSAAIVYGSDQKLVADALARVYTFPPESHAPIVYPAAATPEASPQAEAFLDFLSGQRGQAIFAELGFAPPPQ